LGTPGLSKQTNKAYSLTYMKETYATFTKTWMCSDSASLVSIRHDLRRQQHFM